MIESTAVDVPRGTLVTVRDLLKQHGPSMVKSLPGMNPETLSQMVLTTLIANPALQDCTPFSVITAVTEASQLGLMIDNSLGWAYLIPYRNRKKGIMEAKMQLGYRGIMHLATSGGKVSHIMARVIYEQDEWSIQLGTDPMIHHVPVVDGNRGRPILYYSVATMNDGHKSFDYMTTDELEEVKNFVKTKNNGKLPKVWIEHEVEMGRKSIVRKHGKYLPVSPDCMRALVVDEVQETVEGTEIIDVESFLVGDKPATELRERLTESANTDMTSVKEKAAEATTEAPIEKPSLWECSGCGTPNPAGSDGCITCGLKQGESPPESTEEGLDL